MLDKDATGMPGWHGGDGNAAYLDKTLRHQEMEHKLDESVSWKVILQLVVQAFMAALVAFLIISGISLVVLLFTLAADEPGAGIALFMLLQPLVGLVFVITLLLSRLAEPIAEWRVLLADRPEQVESVYSKIAGTLRRRAVPITPMGHRVYNGFGQDSVSNRLVLKDGPYDAYVSVFKYGSSLYLGWMMWRSRTGFSLFKRFIVDLVLGILGRSTPESQMLRSERARAMREAVHAACREGLVTAVEGTPVPLEFGFPRGIPSPSGGEGMPQVPTQAPPSDAWRSMPSAPVDGGHGPTPQSPYPPGPGVPPQTPGRPPGPGGPEGFDDTPRHGETPPS